MYIVSGLALKLRPIVCLGMDFDLRNYPTPKTRLLRHVRYLPLLRSNSALIFLASCCNAPCPSPRGDPDPATKSRLMTQLVRKYERDFKDPFGRQVIHLLKTYKVCGVNETCIRPARVKILVMTLRHKSPII
jgi:hypothetical protein